MDSPSNPGMTPDTSPNSDGITAFDHPSPRVPPSLDESLITEHRERKLSLTSMDVKTDPILSALHKQQSKPQLNTIPSSVSANFKARPAPKVVEGAGPRMTKSAALRQGMKWDTSRVEKKEGPEKSISHKRMSLNFPIASLAAPAVVPRPTKASQLRTGEAQAPSTAPRPHIALGTADRSRAEHAHRRHSLAMPSSLSAPQIAPRSNRSAELRARPLPVSRMHSALSATTATNVTKELPQKAEVSLKPTRRASVIGMVKSLASPVIAPRSNKTAMLHAPAPSPGVTKTTSPTMASPQPQAKIPTSASGSIVSRMPQSPGPRPTKASLLRAGLCAKVM